MTFLYLPELKRFINLAVVDSITEGRTDNGQMFYQVSFIGNAGPVRVSKDADMTALLEAIDEYTFEPSPKNKNKDKGSDTPPA